MYLTFLGTSSGSPSRQRNVSGIALQPESGRHWLLIDCGEATQHQLLRTPLSPLKLQAVLITHMHGDHCYGLPGLLASAQLCRRRAPLLLIGPAALEPYLAAVMRYTGLRLGFPLAFRVVHEKTLLASAAGFDIEACGLSHGVPSFAYRFTENKVPRRLLVDRLRAEGIAPGPHWGRLQRGEDVRLDDGRVLHGAEYSQPSRRCRRLVVAGDNDQPQRLAPWCADVDLLVHEATYTEAVLAQIGPGPQHSCAAQVARFAAEQCLPHLVLTHFSPRYQLPESQRAKGLSIEQLRLEAAAHYAGDLRLAADFDCFHLKVDGTLERRDARAMKRGQG